MNPTSRFLGACCVALVVASCGGREQAAPAVPDGDAAVEGMPDRPADMADGSALPPGGNDATVLDLGGADARSDGGTDVADAGSETTVSPRMCIAGHTCTGNTRCQRGCFGGLVSRCTCAEGHFVCTGCISVDGGAPDASGPAACASGVVQARRCDTLGSVCQQRGDASPKLCVCGNLGSERVWICQ